MLGIGSSQEKQIFPLLPSPCDISGCSNGSMNLQGLAPAEPAQHSCIIHSSIRRMCGQRQHPTLVLPWAMLEICVPAWPGSAGDTQDTSVPHCCHCCPGQRLWHGDGHSKGHPDGADPTLSRGQLGSPSQQHPIKQCHPRGCDPRSVLLATTPAGMSPGDGFRDRSSQSGYLGRILRGMRSSEGFATTDKSKCPSE